MKNFKDLSEREILALAISLEEEDERVYADFFEGLRHDYSASSAVFDSHRACLLSNHIEPQGTQEPHWLALHEPFYVLPANQRDMFTKFLLIEFDQATAVFRFFLSHARSKLAGSMNEPQRLRRTPAYASF